MGYGEVTQRTFSTLTRRVPRLRSMRKSHVTLAGFGLGLRQQRSRRRRTPRLFLDLRLRQRRDGPPPDRAWRTPAAIPAIRRTKPNRPARTAAQLRWRSRESHPAKSGERRSSSKDFKMSIHIRAVGASTGRGRLLAARAVASSSFAIARPTSPRAKDIGEIGHRNETGSGPEAKARSPSRSGSQSRAPFAMAARLTNSPANQCSARHAMGDAGFDDRPGLLSLLRKPRAPAWPPVRLARTPGPLAVARREAVRKVILGRHRTRARARRRPGFLGAEPLGPHHRLAVRRLQMHSLLSAAHLRS